jgi:hypothetical protein
MTVTPNNAYSYESESEDDDDDDDNFSRIYNNTGENGDNNDVNDDDGDDIASISMFTANEGDADTQYDSDDGAHGEEYTFMASDDVVEEDNRQRLQQKTYNNHTEEEDTTTNTSTPHNNNRSSNTKQQDQYQHQHQTDPRPQQTRPRLNDPNYGDCDFGISQVFQPVIALAPSTSTAEALPDHNDHDQADDDDDDGDGLTVLLDNIDNDIDDIHTLAGGDDGCTIGGSTLLSGSDDINDDTGSSWRRGRERDREQELKQQCDTKCQNDNDISNHNSNANTNNAHSLPATATTDAAGNIINNNPNPAIPMSMSMPESIPKGHRRQKSTSEHSAHTTASQKATKIQKKYEKRLARHENLIPKTYRTSSNKNKNNIKGQHQTPKQQKQPLPKKYQQVQEQEHYDFQNDNPSSNNNNNSNVNINMNTSRDWKDMNASIKSLITKANEQDKENKEQQKRSTIKNKTTKLFGFQKKRLPSIGEPSAIHAHDAASKNSNKSVSQTMSSPKSKNKNNTTFEEVWLILLESPFWVKLILITSLIFMVLSFSFVGVLYLAKFVNEKHQQNATSASAQSSNDNNLRGADIAASYYYAPEYGDNPF